MAVGRARVRIVIATRNAKKLRELQRLVQVPGVEWVTLEAYPQAPAVAETGRTFAANAKKKALSAARVTGGIAMADDSGLEVDYLDGAPGIYSARYAGAHATDAANNQQLLRVLRDVPVQQRGAQFHCAIAVATPRGMVGTVESVIRGRISQDLSGRAGFGYDPLFLVPRYGKTFAELGPRVKDGCSHRCKALRKAVPLIRRAMRQQLQRSRTAVHV
jgi:XTP/dITP diphosphohydrolase